jgi:hypothetical protein
MIPSIKTAARHAHPGTLDASVFILSRAFLAKPPHLKSHGCRAFPH